MQAIAKGLLTFVLPRALINRSSGATDSATYCYSVLMRHLVRVHHATGQVPLGNVAELGPGGSLGAGFAALIAGAHHYCAFDVRPYTRQERNARIFDELVELLAARSPIPGPDEFPGTNPPLAGYGFPSHILTEERLAQALQPARLKPLRDAVQSEQLPVDGPIAYAAPWYDAAQVRASTIDWVFSQAVLEHVDDLSFVYRKCHEWLVPGGLMSHQIDFRSHGTAPTWDGHRALSDLTWRMIRGARFYLINRQPLSYHRAVAQEVGFELVDQAITTTTPTLARSRLAPRFQSWTDEDLNASGAFLVYRKAARREMTSANVGAKSVRPI